MLKKIAALIFLISILQVAACGDGSNSNNQEDQVVFNSKISNGFGVNEFGNAVFE